MVFTQRSCRNSPWNWLVSAGKVVEWSGVAPVRLERGVFPCKCMRPWHPGRQPGQPTDRYIIRWHVVVSSSQSWPFRNRHFVIVPYRCNPCYFRSRTTVQKERKVSLMIVAGTFDHSKWSDCNCLVSFIVELSLSKPDLKANTHKYSQPGQYLKRKYL